MMRRRHVLVVAAGATVLLSVGPLAAPSAASPPTGAAQAAITWGKAIEVPGLGTLNKGGNAEVMSVSCPSAGSCAAVGHYRDGSRHQQGFVVSQNKGRWQKAIEVPGLGSLNKGGNAEVSSLSCPSAGNCAASGFYQDSSHHQQGFVVSQNKGRWQKAIEVPGLGTLNKAPDGTALNAKVLSVSCASPGSCAASGYYGNTIPSAVIAGQGFVVTEKNGRWQQAIKVPGLEALNKGQIAEASSVSCASPGNCTAGGDYATDPAGHSQAFVVSQKNGRWETAREVAGNLNTGSSAHLFSVSCASPGNCTAGGHYRDSSDAIQGFVISQVNGTWAAAREVAGRLNTNGLASVTTVSCPSAGNCSAGGDYDYSYNWGFLVGEKNGVWGTSIKVPGLKALHNVFRFTDVFSVSCASAGNCGAGGDYETPGGTQGYVVSEKNGAWGNAINVPGLTTLNKGSLASTNSVSCAPKGSCVAGGGYKNAGHLQGFVTQDGS